MTAGSGGEKAACLPTRRNFVDPSRRLRQATPTVSASPSVAPPEHPVSTPIKPALERESVENVFGIVLPILVLKGDEIVPGAKVFKDEDAYDFDEPSHVVMGDEEEPDFPEDANAENLWNKVQVIEQLVAEKKIRPNDRCPCQSGKKWKRCCMRKI